MRDACRGRKESSCFISGHLCLAYGACVYVFFLIPGVINFIFFFFFLSKLSSSWSRYKTFFFYTNFIAVSINFCYFFWHFPGCSRDTYYHDFSLREKTQLRTIKSKMNNFIESVTQINIIIILPGLKCYVSMDIKVYVFVRHFI